MTKKKGTLKFSDADLVFHALDGHTISDNGQCCLTCLTCDYEEWLKEKMEAVVVQ